MKHCEKHAEAGIEISWDERHKGRECPLCESYDSEVEKTHEVLREEHRIEALLNLVAALTHGVHDSRTQAEVQAARNLDWKTLFNAQQQRILDEAAEIGDGAAESNVLVHFPPDEKFVIVDLPPEWTCSVNASDSGVGLLVHEDAPPLNRSYTGFVDVKAKRCAPRPVLLASNES